MEVLFLFLLSVISTEATFGILAQPDVKLYYYSTLNPSDGLSIDSSNITGVAQTPFSNEKDTVFYIHGWSDEVLAFTSSGQVLKYLLLQKYDINIFLVDWSGISKKILYPIVTNEVEVAGNMLGSKIWDLVENVGLNLERTTFVGKSLGAHVAGVAGHSLDGQVGQIVGIDPDGPLFSVASFSNRLNKASAKFVEAIHTCRGLVGIFDTVGHADYFVNGGNKQSTCGFDVVGYCSHVISFAYYVESILTGGFRAKSCENYEKFKQGLCAGSRESWMGQYELDKKARGKYFLDTNKYPPFAKN